MKVKLVIFSTLLSICISSRGYFTLPKCTWVGARLNMDLFISKLHAIYIHTHTYMFKLPMQIHTVCYMYIHICVYIHMYIYIYKLQRVLEVIFREYFSKYLEFFKEKVPSCVSWSLLKGNIYSCYLNLRVFCLINL